MVTSLGQMAIPPVASLADRDRYWVVRGSIATGQRTQAARQCLALFPYPDPTGGKVAIMVEPTTADLLAESWS